MVKNKKTAFVLWFDEIGIEDIPLVGGKNASLGEMYQELTKKGVKIPNGFAITAFSYFYFLEKAGIKEKIKAALADLDKKNIRSLIQKGKKTREVIKAAEFPEELKKEIILAYDKLSKQYKTEHVDVAVRSSATAEDLPDASFAGQQETYLNIKGHHELIEACKNCFASLFTNRAISYRVDKGFDHFKIGLSIGIQKMVRSDLACSGVMFSLDTETGFRDVVFITGAYGLGENVVQGAVNPDEYLVFKTTFKKGHSPIISKKVGEKKLKMIYSHDGKHPTKNVDVAEHDRKCFVLTNDEVLILSKWACIIEDHYSKKAGHDKPMDMEWAKDGQSDQLYIVQARPETVHSQEKHNIYKEYILRQKGKLLVKGKAVGNRIGAGSVQVIKDVSGMSKFKKGDVLITEMTDPDWEPIMKIASAIVTDRGGRTCFTGNTRLITDKGFMTIQEIYADENYQNIMVPSLNRDSLKIEWKPILAVMKKRSSVMKIAVSQTGNAKNNTMTLTSDHKMINIRNSQIVDTKIGDILAANECISVAQKIPRVSAPTEKDKKLAYLLGAISTDGHIHTSRTHGEVVFIQKPTPEKEEFISTVTAHMKDVFNKDVKIQAKPKSTGMIRGKPAEGTANAYRLYSKQIACELKKEQQLLVQTMLSAESEIICNFLAGVIDGDGSFNPNSNRINLYISKEYLAQAVIIGCLRLGIVPQVTNNRNIYNIQIVEQLEVLSEYTKRIKAVSNRKCQATRFFNAKQLFGNAKYNYDINARVKNNLLISEKDILRENRVDTTLKNNLNKILSSDIRQLRAVLQENADESLKETDVFNITVADNHNYIVFTEQYTPVLVNNCHAAIISRELGIPCVVGTNNGTELLKNISSVTVDCSQGEDGNVYQGILKFDIEEHDLTHTPKTKTHIMMNLGDPDQAFKLSFIPNSGVGLAREEFVINSYIKVHPLALLHFDKVKDQKTRRLIEDITFGYKIKSDFFVDKLAEGVGMIAAAFYPKPVIVRLSDFKSNEYANLIGGADFEPKEDNPMIGWRGASRYYDKKYSEGFALECAAIKKVREEFGLTNVIVMIPFPRTLDEVRKTLGEMKSNKLVQGQNGLKVYGMCEIPSNVILADEFLDILDGFSIGSNDLTQLILGVDRDSELVAHVYDERNDAVKKMIKQVIEVANKKGKYIGICGQAPSDFPDFAQFLVEAGIQSISLNPDTVIKTTKKIHEKEKKLGIHPK